MADQGNEGLLSPFLREKRFTAARPYLRGDVLDVGCGSGGLAATVPAKSYLGIDIDEESLERAKINYPRHRFSNELPSLDEKFDTIVALALIEHVERPEAFLKRLKENLCDHPQSRIILTTPHPLGEWIHDLGSKFGLFSQHANEEHEELLDRRKLQEIGESAGLKMTTYRPFLFRVNQLAIYKQA